MLLLAAKNSFAGYVISPAARGVTGALSDRIVYTAGGHGWVNFPPWRLQRSAALDMVEDYGNVDQMTFFVYYCFNAGATVVPLRPVGHQTNEVVLDNASASVSFSGDWSTVTNETVYYGTAGSGFHQSVVASDETATATFTPTIPLEGFYPVYTWVPHGPNRTNQLYRIQHTGGESSVHIPHHLVGRGWVYLGTYYFNTGSNTVTGSVTISNLQPNPNTNTVVIADAMRFGNGMSDSGSGYPREDEGAMWWIKNSLGQGQPSSLYLDPGVASDVVDRMSRPKMAAEMNRPQTGRTNRVYISFHSNALNGTARGTVALINSTNATPRQSQLAATLSQEVNDDMISLNSQMEHPWASRGNTLAGGYYEIENGRMGGEMDATILEVAFHDNVMDASLLRDPKVRNWVARASYQAVLRYMTNYDGATGVFLPEPPSNVRAMGVSNGVEISWALPLASGGSGAAAGFVIYRSTNGYGFANPVLINGGSTTTTTLTNLEPNTALYFRVAAFNTGGESFPSETVGCRWSTNFGDPKVLFVNGFNRFDRTTNLKQPIVAQNYQRPGNSGPLERVFPRANNSFDYVVPYGKAIHAFGLPFDSCHKQAITNNLVSLTNYPIVVWETGQDLNDNFNSLAQTHVATFLDANGNLFLSGSGIAFSLDRATGPTASDRAFFNNYFHADLGADVNTNFSVYSFSPSASGIFTNRTSGEFDNGNQGTYWVKSPEMLTPLGAGTKAALFYGGDTNKPAAVQHDGSSGGGKVVYFGFPFETITSASLRESYLTDALTFLGSARVTTHPQDVTAAFDNNAAFSVLASGIAPLNYQWFFNGEPVPGATNHSLTLTHLTLESAGHYSVMVSNRFGLISSRQAVLTVIVPPPQLSFVLRTGESIQFTLSGEAGVNYTIESSSNLTDWVALTNVMSSNGQFQFLEPLTNAQRFYRAFFGD